jgi:hypothetical protein
MAKAPVDLRSLARAYTELGIRTLAGIARNSTSDTARVQAIGMLLDRGWGKAPQAHTGEDGNGIRITVRQIIEGDDKALRADGVDRDQFTERRLAAK